MSTALAIAGVTAVLKNLLDNRLIDDEVTRPLGSVTVTALAPDLIALDKNATSQLNLFLYHVTPNQGWRNEGLPSRDAEGERRTNPPLALDLHYLLTAYGAKDLHAEILLGYGMQVLHETPVLPRSGIRRALGVPGLVYDSPDMLPPQLEAIGTSGLAEQVEQIKITPEVIGSDDLSKLWSGFQSRYRPSASYRVSVVLIEAERSTRVPLPVRARRLHVVQLREPFIERLLLEETPGGTIRTGQTLLRHRLVIRGRGLQDDVTTVRISGVAVTPAPEDLGDAQIIVSIPEELQAGIQTVQVVHEQLMGEPPVPHTGATSNVASFVLHPEILHLAIPPASPAATVVSVRLRPAAGSSQRVVLLLNERIPITSPSNAIRPRAYSFPAPPRPESSPATGDTIDIPIRDVVPATYLARVRVDGADSPLDVDAGGAYISPSVDVP